MREKGIGLVYSPYPLAELPIAAADFCAVVGNLLDNAIEGVSRIKDPAEPPVIRLSFSRSWDMFYIYCENPCAPESIAIDSGRFLSAKRAEPGLHGIGLASIQSIAARAEGRAEFAAENGVFRAKIVLPCLSRR